MKRANGKFCCVLLAVALAASCGGGPTTSTTAAPPAASSAGNAPVATSLSVRPAAPVLFPGEQVRFSAAAGQALVNYDVDWYVNGVRGGNAAAGTISPDGSYSAPPLPVTTVVKAVRRTNPAVSASAPVTVSATAEEAVRPTIFRMVDEDVGPAPTPAGKKITIHGANFATDAKVVVAGQQLAATVVSSHQIETELPILNAAGEVPLFVVNPGTPERIAARNLHVAKDYEHDISSLAPFAATRALADPVLNRALIVSGWTSGVDLVAVELQTHAVTRFAIPSFLADIDSSTGKLYVLQPIGTAEIWQRWYSGCSIDVFDSLTGKFLNSISLAEGSCWDIRIQPSLHRAYIPDNSRGTIRVVNLESGAEEGSIGPLIPASGIPNYAPEIRLRLQPTSTTGVVTDGVNQLALVDLNTGTITQRVQLQAPATEFTLDEARGRVYVASSDTFNFEMRAYELATNKVVGYATISATPFFKGPILLSPDGAHLLVSALRDFAGGIVGGDVWVIDAESLAVRTRIPMTQAGQMVSVGNTVVSAWYTLTTLDLAKDLGVRQLGAITASRNGVDQIDLSISGVNLGDLDPVLYFDGAMVELTPIAGQPSSFRATVPLAWAESTQLHSVWMGALDATPTNVLGFGFSAQPIGGDARNATFCLGANGMAILADSSAARWLDLRKGTELRRTTPGARGCTFDDTGATAILLNSRGLEVYAANTATLLTTATSVAPDWWNTVVLDSSTGLAYTSGGAVIDTNTGQLVEMLPHFLGWDNRTLGFEGYLGIDSQTRRLVGYWYSLDLNTNTASESGINYAIAGPSGAAAPWGTFGVDKQNHLAIMPWRYGEVVLIDMQSGQLQTAWTGGELYFGACAGDGLGFVLDRVTPAVIAVDLHTGETLAKFASASLPSQCAYDRDNRTLWVLSAREGLLFEIAVGKALAPPPPPAPPPAG